jgi:hypothetical protein
MKTVDTPKVLKPAAVSFKTLDGSVVEGKVNLGYENRVSDLFTKTDDPFIVVFDAMYVGSPKKKVLVLNKQHIVWAEPVAE